jgi:hypothetical protein
MCERDVENIRRMIIEVFGHDFECFGNPVESCLHGKRWIMQLEPCKSCIVLYGKHLEKLMRPGVEKNE